MKGLSKLKILLILLMFLLGANSLNAASSGLFFSVSSKQVQKGDRFTVDVKVSSPNQSINAVSGAMTYPESLVRMVAISKDKSIISFWTEDPSAGRNKISFEGVVLNPGFKGSSGLVFRVTFEAKKEGTVLFGFSEGSILANDGQGTNILASLGSATLQISPAGVLPAVDSGSIAQVEETGKLLALPVITDYSPSVESKDGFYLKGKGQPSALTKIVFRDISVKTVGEQLIALTQSEKKKLGEILVKNDTSGAFEYISSRDLVAGVYNAALFLVDDVTNTEKPGLGVQLLVNDSKIVKGLVVLLNILALLILISVLGVIIYFVPWYSWRRMRVMKKKLGLKEEKLTIFGHQLERQDKILDQNMDKIPNTGTLTGQ